mmetsp:Transcript_75857/g.214490  ORF Transcript_75857/g.214490 Transcript_75857/m.214490 type:complete len:274 (-) Transcript_75857:382-1203(-)
MLPGPMAANRSASTDASAMCCTGCRPIQPAETLVARTGPDDPGPPTATTTDRSDSEEPDTDSDSDNGHRFSPEDTVLIFDWDDTVLPSSWVQEQGLRLDGDYMLTSYQQEELGDLTRLAAETLCLAKQLGTVVLVTNSERGWIELSCQKFMPALNPSLENVKLLSARSQYERPDLASPFEWKLRAFESEITRIFVPSKDGHRRKNVLSLGDSAHEREALIHATANLPNCRTKSLKFAERPGVEQLRKQHMLVASCLRRIVHHDGNLDLCIRPM